MTDDIQWTMPDGRPVEADDLRHSARVGDCEEAVRCTLLAGAELIDTLAHAVADAQRETAVERAIVARVADERDRVRRINEGLREQVEQGHRSYDAALTLTAEAMSAADNNNEAAVRAAADLDLFTAANADLRARITELEADTDQRRATTDQLEVAIAKTLAEADGYEWGELSTEDRGGYGRGAAEVVARYLAAPSPAGEPAKGRIRLGFHEDGTCSAEIATVPPSPAGEAEPDETRPGGWVPGIGWVALKRDLPVGSLFTITVDSVAPRMIDYPSPSPQPVIATRWPDGSTPAPAPSQGEGEQT